MRRIILVMGCGRPRAISMRFPYRRDYYNITDASLDRIVRLLKAVGVDEEQFVAGRTFVVSKDILKGTYVVVSP